MSIIVFDLETTISSEYHGPDAKDPINDFHTLIWGVSEENVVVEHKVEGFKREPSRMFISALTGSDILVGHNLSFDLPYIWDNHFTQQWLKYGGQIWDTQLAEYLMSGQRHSFPSLAELQLIYLGEKVKEDRISKLYRKGIGADKILAAKDRCPRLFKLYDKYSRGDGETTIKIYKEQLKRAEKLGMLKTIKMFQAYLLSLIQCMTTGIEIDKVKCEKTLRDFNLKEVELLQKAQELVGPYWTDERLPEFNISSNDHKSVILFGGQIKCKVKEQQGYYKNGNPKFKTVEQLVSVPGFKLSKEYTTEAKKEGFYKTDNAVVSKILNNSGHETAIKFCQLQQAAANLKKMANTYLAAFLRQSISSRLYPNFNVCATVTSRLSSSKPNLQNVPSKGKMAKAIQGCFVAPKGWKAVQIDFSQLEIYVTAWLSGDEAMTKDLLGGIDFHCLRLSWAASMSEGKTYEEIYKLAKVDEVPEWALKRSKAKTISYQKAYGAGPKKLAESTGLHLEDVKELLNKEDSIYYRVKAFNDHVAKQAENTAEYSHSNHIPKALKKGGIHGKRFNREGYELLPIQYGDRNIFEDGLYRNVGYYQSITGKRYSYEEYASYDKDGRLRRNFSPTQTKNYAIQGTAADIVAVVTAAILPLLLKHGDKVEFINTIHDSLWFYVKEDEIDLIVPKLITIMESTPRLFKYYLNINMPFYVPVDAEIGPNFADLTTYNKDKQ